MNRHYDVLSKERAKKNPSQEVLRIYLNEEFEVRGGWVLYFNVDVRCIEILEKYPCFKQSIKVYYHVLSNRKLF